MNTKIILAIIIIGMLVGIGYWYATQQTSAPFMPPGDDTSQITNFAECAAAGNPVLESYPRQCRANGQTFEEGISQDSSETLCDESMRNADVCAQIYDPVCALVEIQCITTQCNPISETFSNPCEACSNSLVRSYTRGACEE